MLLRQQFDCLTPAIASLVRAARDSALSGLQSPLGLAQKLRIFDDLTRRERGEVFNADINSHCGASLNGRKDGVCSDRCYYHAHKGLLPRHMMHLTTYDEELIPLITLEDQRRFKEATLS